ncbi:MAG: hypothetical protein FWB95_08835 [Treponema sp.]|nr:hypothetical protein [Treponema sp.]
MKNKIKWLYFIAIIAIIGLSFTACDKDDGGGKKVITKFKFTNSGNAQPTASIAAARSAVPMAVTINNSFTSYTNFYSTTLGGNTNRKAQITPSSFKLEINNVIVCGTNTTHGTVAIPLIEQHATLVEFIGNVPITPGDVYPGTYDMVLSDSITTSGGGQSIVKFKWPANAGDFANNIHMMSSQATIDDGIVSVRIGDLTPGAVNAVLIMGDPTSPFQSSSLCLYFAGDEYKLVTVGPSSTLTQKDILPHYGDGINDRLITTGPSYTAEAFIVPFNPITVPEDASAVTFTISWNMDNMIEMYLPAGKPDNAENYYFVLKNGWWNDLSISASIE